MNYKIKEVKLGNPKFELEMYVRTHDAFPSKNNVFLLNLLG